jgi:hypothetical protein
MQVFKEFQQGCTIFDVVLELYLSLNLLPKLIYDNGITDINAITTTGQKFLYDTEFIYNEKMSDEITKKNYKFRTGDFSVPQYKFLPNDAYVISQIDNGNSAYLFGSFTGYSLNNTPSRHIIKLNQDLTIDTSFNVGTGFNLTTYLGEGIIQQPDGKIIAFGTFTSYNGTSSVRIIRLNTDGSIDNSFVTGSGFYGNSINYTCGASIDSLGNIIVCGRYNQYNGVNPPMRLLTKLNSNGVMDMTFSASTSFNDVTICSLINSNDSMFIGGYFSAFSGASANRIIKLNSNGTRDNSFAVGTGFNGNVTGFLRISGETSFYVFGSFTTYKGISANRIIKLNLDGTIDNNFVSGSGFGNISFYTLSVIWTNKLLIYGNFTSYNGIPSLNNIILNSDGTIFQSFTTKYEIMFAIGNKLYGSKPNDYLKLIKTNSTPIF